MAIDLHTRVVDTSLPQKKHDEEDDDDDLIVTLHNHNDSPSSGLKPPVLIPHQFGSKIRTSSTLPRYRVEQGIVINKDEEFVAELTRRMTHLMLQQGDDKFKFSGISSWKSERSWDSPMGSPQSTLWSNLSSSLGSPEGSSKEPSSPPWNSRESRRESTQYAFGMLEKMRIDERSDNSSYHHHHGYGKQSMMKIFNVGTCCSRQSLIQEQIRAIQLSRLKQEQILALKQKLAAYRESEYKEVVSDGIRREGHLLHQQPPCSEMQAISMGGLDSRAGSCGTGVFFPRSRINVASSNFSKRPGKGCSNILIPARVVHALQLHHFDQMASTSRPKPAAFPPLQGVLVSNRDGMYSLQKHQSRKPQANMQNNDTILPQEWTY